MRSKSALVALFSLISVSAAIVGTSTPAPPLTEARIAKLPRAQQTPWRQYLQRSVQQMRDDRATLADELKRAGMTDALTPPSSSGARSIPLSRTADWYAGPEARRIADIIVSFQTPAGGWSKNINLADHIRRNGEHFAPNNLSRFLTAGDFDAPSDI